MSFVVTVAETASMDLTAIAHWIADQSDVDTALAYVDRIQARFDTLADFPRRDTPRDDLAPGVRSFSFERRLLILYRVTDEEVVVLRVTHAAREQEGLLA